MLALEQIQVGHILIDNDYYYQPYSDNDPYFVGYADMDDDTIPVEGLIYMTCDTKEEAKLASEKLVHLAELYNHSLLRTVYSFTEWLDIQERRTKQ